MRWRSLLTKSQLAHLREFSVTTLSDFAALREAQAEHARRHYDGDISRICWECSEVERRLKAKGRL